MPVDAANAKSIFLAALEKSDPVERAKYLDEACAGDDGLRARVNALLSAHESGSFPDFVADAAPAFEATQSVISTPNDATLTAGDAAHSDGRSLSFLDPPREPGNLGRLDHYEVQSVLGQGGMGIVLKAFDNSLDRIVAIKVLGSQYAANGTARKRFIREAKAVAAVTHEHVVHVYAVDERVPYLVMQYIQGISLQDRIDKSGPLELKEILRIGMQIADGLAAAHKQGIVHRDIKPSNILLENGVERVKLTDFGLARAVDDASVTQSGVIAGTPMYMSPEQARGEQVDPRSDLFSLGSVLYAMCTGHAPFRASGTMAVMKRVIEDSPRSICDQHAEIPEWLEAIVFKLLAKHPDDRFQSAKDVAQLLEQHLAHLQQPSAVTMPAAVERPLTRKPRRPAPPPKRSSFPKWLVAVILLIVVAPCVVIVGLVGLWWLALFGSDAPPKFNDDRMSLQPHGQDGMAVNTESKPNLTVNLNQPSLRVAVVAEDGTPFPVEKDWVTATCRGLPPGRYHARVYRPGNPEVLVAQEWFDLLTTGSAFTFRADSNWTQLFNGQDLTGWRTFPEDRKNWNVVNGMLTAKGAPSHLFSERGDFINFHLRMRIRLHKNSACGHFARVPRGDPGLLLMPFGDGELYRRDVPALYAIDPKSIDPAVPTRRTSSLSVWGVGKQGEAIVAKVPTDGWYGPEMIVDGPNITVVMNGIKTFTTGWQGKRTDGHIALQLFDSDSEVQYSHIEYKELPSQIRDEDRLQGSWHAVEGEFGGEKLSADELKTAKITFTGEQMRRAFPPKGVEGEGSFTLNPTASPKQITIKGLSAKNTATDGIYRFEGERLILCVGGVSDPRPTEFSSKGAKSRSLIVYERDPVEPSADQKQLQGKWQAVEGQFGGVKLSALDLKAAQLTINGDQMRIPLPPKGVISDCQFVLNSSASPKQITIKRLTDPMQSLEGIYVFDGDRLYLCVAGEMAPRPEGFSSQVGTSLLLLAFERESKGGAKSIELTPPKVLPHMVGAWSLEMERQSGPDGKDRGKSTGHVVVEPVAGGEHFAIHTQTDDGGPYGLSIISLDKKAWRFKSRFFDPSGYVSDISNGDFDSKAKLLLMTNLTKDNLVLTRRQTFIDADTIRLKMTTHDKAGKVVFDANGVMRRLPKGRELGPAADEMQQVPEELALLDRLIGVWDLDFTSQKTGMKWRAEMTGYKVLGGRFIETRERNLPTGEENYALTTYDPAAKVYRQWYVSSRWPSAEGTGKWDGATKTLTWDCRGADETNPVSTSFTKKFVSDDKSEFTVVVKDKDGKVLEDLVGTETRRPKSK